DAGHPYLQRNALALYERDGGLLWRHYDEEANRAEARRARGLGVSFTATSGDYDYVLNWVFHPARTPEREALVTGLTERQTRAGAGDGHEGRQGVGGVGGGGGGGGHGGAVRPPGRAERAGHQPPALLHLPPRPGRGRSEPEHGDGDGNARGGAWRGQSRRKRVHHDRGAA